jgi:hypothetical protein
MSPCGIYCSWHGLTVAVRYCTDMVSLWLYVTVPGIVSQWLYVTVPGIVSLWLYVTVLAWSHCGCMLLYWHGLTVAVCYCTSMVSLWLYVTVLAWSHYVMKQFDRITCQRCYL